MVVLTAAVILVGALCLLDLLLTFGVIRRLREHTATLTELVRRGDSGPTGFPAPSRPIGEFIASTVDGEPVSPDLLDNHTAVVFMAPECTSCRAQLPELLSWAGERDRQRVLVVIDGSISGGADLVEPLNAVARVIVDGAGTPVIGAFGVDSFPAACVVSDGRVIASGPDVTRLPAPV